MPARTTGTHIQVTFRGETAQAFIPHPLPPADPPLELSLSLQALMERAHLALGRLDRLIDEFPSPDLLIQFYQRKEAVVSSQIEGTMSTMTDLLLHELDGSQHSSPEDAQLNANYFKAIEHGIEAAKQLSLSKRMIRELHRTLLSGTADEGKTPGEFRRVPLVVSLNDETSSIFRQNASRTAWITWAIIMTCRRCRRCQALVYFETITVPRRQRPRWRMLICFCTIGILRYRSST
jgi:hypothetical protein